MGLKFDGREHSGLADAKNTAKLLAKMIKDGCVLGLTKGLKDTKIDPKIAFDDNQLNLVNLQLQTSPATTSKSPGNTSNPRKENNNSWTGIRKTPPLCGCGRRSKFLVVSKPGPNCGRRFYSCPKTSGCQFFKWDSPENNLGQSPAFKPPRQVIMK